MVPSKGHLMANLQRLTFSSFGIYEVFDMSIFVQGNTAPPSKCILKNTLVHSHFVCKVPKIWVQQLHHHFMINREMHFEAQSFLGVCNSCLDAYLTKSMLIEAVFLMKMLTWIAKLSSLTKKELHALIWLIFLWSK